MEQVHRPGQPSMMSNRWVAMVIAVGLLAGCEPPYDPLDFRTDQAPIFRAGRLQTAPIPEPPVQLRVMAWNIKYAGGRIPFWFDCWGDRVAMSRAEVEANLSGINELIKEVDPDILMVEEIELWSRRSAYTNMVQEILDHTSLNYGAYFSSWNSRYIPSEGLGRMNLGVAIFSKHPLVEAVRIKQEDRTDLDPLTHAFYIRRVIGRAVVEPRPGEQVAAYVVHTEAYDQDGTKQKQIQHILDQVRQEALPFVLGGDFNELPPTAIQVVDFPDERSRPVCSDDFDLPPYTPALMLPFYQDLVPWIPLERYGTTEEEQRRYYTHSVLGPDEVNEHGEVGFWNRTLDYLFVDGASSWLRDTTDVLQVAGQQVGASGPLLHSDPLRLSDHAPVVGTWQVGR